MQLVNIAKLILGIIMVAISFVKLFSNSVVLPDKEHGTIHTTQKYSIMILLSHKGKLISNGYLIIHLVSMLATGVALMNMNSAYLQIISHVLFVFEAVCFILGYLQAARSVIKY